jgi:hypothetical protein
LLSPSSFPRLGMSRAPLSLPTSWYEHQASETAAHGDSLAGLLDGAISDQARASMGLCASDARGIRAGGGNVAAVLE